MVQNAIVLLVILLMATCRKEPGVSAPTPSAPVLQWGMPIDRLHEAARELDRKGQQAPLHWFTIADGDGEELIGMSIACEGTRFLLVFRDRVLDKMGAFSSGDLRWQGSWSEADGTWQAIVARATNPGWTSLSPEQVRDLCRQRKEESRRARRHMEPLPPAVMAIWLLSPRPNAPKQRQRSRELLTMYDATRVRIGDAEDDVVRAFGEPAERIPDDGGVMTRHGDAEDLGWQPVPVVRVWTKDGRVYRVVTEYPTPHP